MESKKHLLAISLQDAAINLLATGYSVREAAKILNVEPSTIRHWWGADPQFKTTVATLRQQAASTPAPLDDKSDVGRR
jgi:transposase